MKLLAIVSSFYPDIEELEKNTNSYLPCVDKLIVWENTPQEDSYIGQLLERFPSDKVAVQTTGKNEYLAEPFNRCFRYAQANGYTHVLTMDQDSRFTEGHFEKYLDLVSHYPPEKIAVFGPHTDQKSVASDIIREIDSVIMSGAIYPIETFWTLGGFDEQLVIDAVDTEYCMRARESSYHTIQIDSVFLEHHLGYRHKHWLGLTLVPYSAQRTYYYLRNTLWIWNVYPQYFPREYRKHFIKYRIIFRLLKIMFEKHSVKKVYSIFLGIKHYKLGRLGRYDNFQ